MSVPISETKKNNHFGLLRPNSKASLNLYAEQFVLEALHSHEGTALDYHELASTYAKVCKDDPLMTNEHLLKTAIHALVKNNTVHFAFIEGKGIHYYIEEKKLSSERAGERYDAEGNKRTQPVLYPYVPVKDYVTEVPFTPPTPPIVPEKKSSAYLIKKYGTADSLQIRKARLYRMSVPTKARLWFFGNAFKGKKFLPNGTKSGKIVYQEARTAFELLWQQSKEQIIKDYLATNPQPPKEAKVEKLV